MPSARLLFLGLDAAEPSLLERWMRDGTMPTLASLRSDAVWGPTTNAPGLYPGSIWPSFHTGLQPGRHGRYFFQQLVHGTYRSAPILMQDLTIAPFWSALDAAGLRVAVCDLPKAPLVGLVHGLQLADWGVHDPEGPPRSSPERLAAEIVARHGPDPVGPCGRAVRTCTTLAEVRDRLLVRIERKVAIVTDLLQRESWDLFATVFAESHCAGHHFWSLHDATHPRHAPALLEQLGGDPLRAVYAAIDGAIARILDGIGRNTTVVVLASHGMGPHYGATAMLDRILRRLERSPAPRDPAPATRERRTTPESLRTAWRRMPAGLRAAVAPVSDWLYDVMQARDRGLRTCFQVATNASGAGIRINLVGREPRGIVSQGAEYDRLCDRLAADLREIVNVETGAPIVEAVIRTDRVFPGPQAHALPDLVVHWNQTSPTRAIRSPKIGTIEANHHEIRTGDHRKGGMFLARGPGLLPGQRIEPIREIDFAPTFARLLGCALLDVDGKAIAELCPVS